MPRATHKLQAPKGTRDFYPSDLALRRHIESVWRNVSINHGFDEVEGPTFEHLELYTIKSGPGIVSELFTFRRAGGEVDYALRPEFTPTLARMVAAAAQSLPKPIKWFSIPTHFRAERPQRGRLREFLQWNADILGDESASADAEVIAVTVGILQTLGMTPRQAQVRISHRGVVSDVLLGGGLPPDRLTEAFDLLDRRDKLPENDFQRRAEAIGLAEDSITQLGNDRQQSLARLDALPGDIAEHLGGESASFLALLEELKRHDLEEWCTLDFGIVRGLAYYTGTVFEVHETSGRERAIAGGGRYDGLVELFGGPPTPAVGIAMGDVVIRLVLEDLGLLGPAERYLPKPDVFVIDLSPVVAGKASPLYQVVADLRRRGLHVRHSYRATRNVGKLLSEASRAGARTAVILGEELREGKVSVKDLQSGAQREINASRLAEELESTV